MQYELIPVGVDGCRGGWCVVCSAEVWCVATFAELLEKVGEAAVIAVDMPIGLLDRAAAGGRACDREARRILGPGRASTVFSPPVRPALDAASYGEALRINRETSPERIGISKQAYNLFAWIRDLDSVLAHRPKQRIVEAHPELAFQALNGNRPLATKKRTTAGRCQRTALLKDAGYHWIEAALGRPPKGATREDVLDATVLCWTAQRVAQGTACHVPKTPAYDSRGLPMAIWW